MRTIKEVANAANISKTSVYNLVKRHNIKAFKKDGITYLDENAVNIILAHYSSEKHDTISDILNNSKTDNEGGFQGSFQPDFQPKLKDESAEIIRILEDERAEKNKVIQALIQSNQILSQALAADKVNETARLIMQNTGYESDENIKSSRKGFLKRFFGKR